MSSYIEASAGTGKTYTIEHKVLGYVKSGIDLDKILIVTFTEKAAGELRHRIRTILTENNGDSLCKAALAKVDNAAIHTIHSFCQRMLQEYAFEAGEPFSQTLVDDSQISTLIEKKIRNEWAEAICNKGLDPAKLSRILIQASMLKSQGVKCVPSLASQFSKAHNYKELQQISGMQTLLTEIREYIAKAPNKTVIKKFDALKDWKLGDKFLNGITEKSIEDEALYATVDIYKKASKDYQKSNLYEQFVIGCLDNLVNEWTDYKSKNGLQSYNDMIVKLRDKLYDDHDEALLQILRQRFTHAIIDEFQDTNALQWDIFKKIFLNVPGHNILVVGDPKQSIFSFQGADLNVYSKAIGEIKCMDNKDPHLPNYRSTNSMIRACNAIFQTSGFKKNINFTSSHCPDPQNVKAEPTFEGNPLKPLLIQNPAGDAKQFAELVAKKIIELASFDKDGHTRLQVFDKDDCHRLRNVSLKDFAVIYKTRRESYEMERAFRKYGIPFTKYKNRKLFASRECEEWISLFRVLNADDFNGDNDKLLNELYLTDFFISDDKRSGLINQVMSWRILASEGKYAEMFEAIYNQSDIKETLNHVDKMQSLGHLRQIGDYCINYLYQKNTSIDSLIDHLLKRHDSDVSAGDDEGTLVEKSSDFEAVQMLTIHAAKGLEFPVVIPLYGLKEYREMSSVYVYHDINHEHCMGLGDDAKEMKKKETSEEWNRLFYVVLTRASSLLMLPVYNLKDKKGYESIYGAFKPIDDSLKDYYDDLKVEEREDSTWRQALKDILNKNEQSNENKTSLQLQKTVIGKINDDLPLKIRRQHSYSSLSNHKHSTAVLNNGRPADGMAQEAEEEVIVEEPKSYPRGASLGNALHSTLEAICNGEEGLSFASFKDPLPALKDVLNNDALYKLIDSKFQDENLHSKHPEVYKEWIKHSRDIIWNTLNAKLEGDIRLCDLKPGDSIAEMEYYMDASEEDFDAYCKGFMDLVFRIGDKYYIIDWKSDYLDHYDETSVGKKVDEDYAVQRVLYPYVFIKWLNKMLGKEEVDVFNDNFGGMYYVFLRGTRENSNQGTHYYMWNSFEDFEKEYKDKVGDKIKAIALHKKK